MTGLGFLCAICSGVLIGRRLGRLQARLQSDDDKRTIARLNGECDANNQTIDKLLELLGNELRGGRRP